mmetsp:Transcript_39016/g.108542  ORF Transcript_39016/g.108542 Transcript_39016/m.108542 type:complete len:116 (+) Transcript_39016:70-417(+)
MLGCASSTVNTVEQIKHIQTVMSALHTTTVMEKTGQNKSGTISMQSAESQHQALPAHSHTKPTAKNNASTANAHRKVFCSATIDTTTLAGQLKKRPPTSHVLSLAEASHCAGHVW